MDSYSMNPSLRRLKERGDAEEQAHASEIRRLEIEPSANGKFSVLCEYESGRHTQQELDASGVSEKVAELTGEQGKPGGALGELAALLPQNPKKVTVKVKAKAADEESEDEE